MGGYHGPLGLARFQKNILNAVNLRKYDAGEVIVSGGQLIALLLTDSWPQHDNNNMTSLSSWTSSCL